MKKWFAILFAIAVLLIAGVPTMSASAGGGDITPYWEFYNDIIPGEEGARLIHTTDVRIYAAYILECDGEETEAVFEEPWSGIAWIYEEGDVRLKEVKALVSWYNPSTESWNKAQWIVAEQSCGAEKPCEIGCGAPIWESATGKYGDGMAMVWHDPGVGPMVTSFSYFPFSYETADGELLVAEANTSTFDEVAKYTLYTTAEIANSSILWGEAGIGDPYRDHGPVYKYIACSVAPGFRDTIDGIAYFKPGHTIANWATLMLENEFFMTEQYRGDAALTWATELAELGELALP